MCRLAVGEPFSKLQNGGERQPPGRKSGLSMPRKECQKGVIREEGIQFIGHS
jgi:hypothetical protein